MCEAIVARLNALKDPATGEPWADKIFRREQIYQGPRVSDAPDVAFLPRDMRYLALGNADFTSNKFIVDAFGISGCHRMHGVLIATGGGLRSATRASAARIVDVTPTLLYLTGQPLPGDMDGQVLTEMISAEFLSANPITVASQTDAEQTSEVNFLPEENEEVIERLKGLGYIG